MPNKVKMIKPTGDVISVDEKDVGLFTALKYRPLSQEESSARITEEERARYFEGQKLKTAWEGIKAGATLGISRLGADVEQQQRAAYNPKTALASEVGTILLSSAVGGSAGGLSRVGTAFAPSVAAEMVGQGVGRLAAGAGVRPGVSAIIGTGIEGGIQGVGQVIGDYGLHDDPLTAETLLAGAGVGTFLGIGAGVIGAGLSKAGKAIRRHGEVIEDVTDLSTIRGKRPTMATADVLSDTDYAGLRSHVTDLRTELKATIDDTHGLLRTVKKEQAGRLADLGEAGRREAVAAKAYDAQTKAQLAKYSSDFKSLDEAESAFAAKAASYEEETKGLLRAYSTSYKEMDDALTTASRGTINVRALVDDVKNKADDLFGQLGVDPAMSKTFAKEISDVRKLRADYSKIIKGRNTIDIADYYNDYYDVVSRLATKMGEPLPKKTKLTRQMLDKVLSADDYALKAKNIAKEIEDFAIPPAPQRAPGMLRAEQQLDEFAVPDFAGAGPTLTQKANAQLGSSLESMLSEKLTQLKAAGEVADMLKGFPKSKQAYLNLSEAKRASLTDAIERASGLAGISPKAKELIDKVAEITKKTGVRTTGSVAEQFGHAADAAAAAEGKLRPGDVKRIKSDKVKGHYPGLERGMARTVASWAGKAATRMGFPAGINPLIRELGWEAGKKLPGFAMGYAASGGDVTSGVATALVLHGGVKNRLLRASGRLMEGLGKATTMSAPALTAILNDSRLGDDESATNLREAAKKRAAEYVAMSAGVAREQLSAGLDEIRSISPELARRMHDRGTEVIGYIAANVPKDPGTVMVGGKSRWEMSDQEARMTAETIYGAMHPLEAVDDFVAGKLSPYAIRAFKDCWPELHSYAVNEVMQQMPALLKNADNAKRSQLSYFTGITLSSSQEPDTIRFLQENLMSAPTNAADRAAPPNTPQPSQQAQSMQTSSQKLTDR